MKAIRKAIGLVVLGTLLVPASVIIIEHDRGVAEAPVGYGSEVRSEGPAGYGTEVKAEAPIGFGREVRGEAPGTFGTERGADLKG
jgi:hypothetical protein